MKKKLFSIFLAVAMAVTMMPMMALNSNATEQLQLLSTSKQEGLQLVKEQPDYIILSAATSGKKAIKLSWTKVDNATKYVVYGTMCNKKMTKLVTLKSTKKSYKVVKIKKNKLKAHKAYKFYVRAYKGNSKLAQSKTIHFITDKTMGKYANVTKVSAEKTLDLTLNDAEKEKANVKASYKVYKNKKHLSKVHGVKIKYFSTDKTVATVDSKGDVQAVGEGEAIIYSQDIGGKYAKTTVTVSVKEEDEPEQEPTYPVGPKDEPQPTGNEILKAVAVKNGEQTTDSYGDAIDAYTLTYYFDEQEPSEYDVDGPENDAYIVYSGDELPLNHTGIKNSPLTTEKHSAGCYHYEGEGFDEVYHWPYRDLLLNINRVEIDESMKLCNTFTSMAFMFAYMSNLKDYKGFQYLNISNVKDMSAMFLGSSRNDVEIETYPDVSKWNTKNVEHMPAMFKEFGLLNTYISKAPNVKYWNVGKCEDFSGMFAAYGAYSDFLNSCPDVTRWNTESATNMADMFSCYGANANKLRSVPNVKYWDVRKVKDMSGMFEQVGIVPEFNAVPDVSRWKTDSLENIRQIFCNYGNGNVWGYQQPGSLTKVPDVSKWNTSKIKYMDNAFLAYASGSPGFNAVPDVSNWDTSNVLDISSMFFEYAGASRELSKVPDVSKWNISKLIDAGCVFQYYGKSSTNIKEYPAVDKWTDSRILNMYSFFTGYAEMSDINEVLDLSNLINDNVFELPQTMQDEVNQEAEYAYSTNRDFPDLPEYGDAVGMSVKKFKVNREIPQGESVAFANMIPDFSKWLDEEGNVYTDGMTLKPGTYTKLMPIGGKIFYADKNISDGYKFYKESQTGEVSLITGWSIGDDNLPIGLDDAVYYVKDDTITEDKFYAFNNGITAPGTKQENETRWGCFHGDSYISLGTNDGIGEGEKNTAKALSSDYYSNWASLFRSADEEQKSNSIWSAINQNNGGMDFGLTGYSPYLACNDWFVGTKAEYDILNESGLAVQEMYIVEEDETRDISLFERFDIWSSVEDRTSNGKNAYVWSYEDNEWKSVDKNSPAGLVLIRAF